MRTSTAVFIALAWRVFTAVTTRTFFQPDEFYQSLEVAHHAVFGYGHLTWEWTANPPIRSIVFPALYMPVYWLLKVTKLDDIELLVSAPKALQGALAAITDISTRKLAKEVFGDRYADTVFFMSLSSFFHLLCLGRTLSNSVETSLTTAALCFWPWNLSNWKARQITAALTLAALSCMVRPTSAVVWIYLVLDLLWRSSMNVRIIKTLFLNCTLIGAASTTALYLVDSCYFRKPTFTPLNFLTTNLSSVSSFYGLNQWHYYLTQGLPIVLNVYLPFYILGSWSVVKSAQAHQKSLARLMLWTVFVYSLLGHKEWRFLHPVLPAALVLSSKAYKDYSIGREKSLKKHETVSKSRLLWVLTALSIIPSTYVMQFHGRAQVDVMNYLRTLDDSKLRSAGFLMPCHSVPWQSHLHRPHLAGHGLLWALGCEPPLHKSDSHANAISCYQDQSDIFYSSPLTYLRSNFPTRVDQNFPPSPFPSTKPGDYPPGDQRWEHRWPSHLVFFGALLNDNTEGHKVALYLKQLGYKEVWVGRNGFEEDWRRRGGVHVWQVGS